MQIQILPITGADSSIDALTKRLERLGIVLVAPDTKVACTSEYTLELGFHNILLFRESLSIILRQHGFMIKPNSDEEVPV